MIKKCYRKETLKSGIKRLLGLNLEFLKVNITYPMVLKDAVNNAPRRT
ncbi:MAG: hypothetical protein ACJA0G_001464 [Kangiellaceae bacterium]|jgi:hypothetical protein